jgi:hypothetical protein
MIVIDGKWTMEGETDNLIQLKTSKELSDLVNKVGFLPLFKGEINGFSVEERTNATDWWAGNPEKDPWEWRTVIAAEGDIAYGKLFRNKAGFISKEWYPIFAAYRRDGYDFDSRYEDGLASRKAKNIIDVLTEQPILPSFKIKEYAGFCKDGEKGFDSAMTLLQMQTYITVRGFQRKRSKKGEEYGWAVGLYSLSEDLFGEDYVHSAYHIPAVLARDKIISHLREMFPDVSYEKALKSV